MARVVAENIARYRVKNMQTPKWASEFVMNEMYDLARRRSTTTGIKWHVDHVFPLKHEAVCGLHVETNMRVVPAVLNLRKGNRFSVSPNGD